MTWIKAGRLFTRMENFKEYYYRPARDANGNEFYEFWAIRNDDKKIKLGVKKLRSDAEADAIVRQLLSLEKDTLKLVIDFDEVNV